MATDNQLTYEAFAKYYDSSDIDRRPEIEFYGSLLRGDDRAILELACGSGNILGELAGPILAKQGDARLVGLDVSTAMLNIARSRYPRVEWIEGDMRDPPRLAPFDLIFCAINTLQVILTEAELEMTFRAVRALLKPDGVFAFDIYQPNLDYLKAWPADQILRRFTGPDGAPLAIREMAQFDADSLILSLDWHVVRQYGAPGDSLASLRLKIRQYFPTEIDRMLNAAGLRVASRHGDIQRAAFTPQSRKLVAVCVPATA